MSDQSNNSQALILLTGASGALGRVLARELSAKGWRLRLTDKAPFPDPLPPGCEFAFADLEDRESLFRLAQGCETILHFGGVSLEEPFDTVLGPNICGTYNVYEAARRVGARVIYASSHHVAGFYERGTEVSVTSPMRPDGHYAISKVYGEMLGRMYRDKHGVETVQLRIGVSRPEPSEDRMLFTWLSHPDLVHLVECSMLAEDVDCITVWGVSANRRMTWWCDDERDRIGWEPYDDAERHSAAVEGKTSGDPVAERYQGAWFCSRDYSRKTQTGQ